MKILVVNQPLNNRGDEAAHRSLMRGLNSKFPNAQITVYFSNANQNSVDQMTVKSAKNKYINVINSFTKGSSFLNRWCLKLNVPKLSLIHPTNVGVAKLIKETDLVVCAPGGICMGLFQSWAHIYNLALALAFKKRIVYYSRSFGPFPEVTSWNKVFKKVSYNLLKNFDFISIRDSKTMVLADEIGLQYVPSIDTAFLDTPNVEIPLSISSQINGSDYIVFVPNSLTWHPAFENTSKNFLENFYCKILERLLEIYPDEKIVMLPQLFNNKEQGDYNYFLRLKSKVDNDRILVISDEYSSDIQQTIISKSKLMIGSRYHSVVFAVNNIVPFVALSYEHKVSGLLKILNLEDRNYDIEKFGRGYTNIDLAINEIEKLIKTASANKNAKITANKIAEKCMEELSERYV